MFKRKKANKSNYYFDSFPVLAHYSVMCGEMILEYLRNFDPKRLEEVKTSVHEIEHQADDLKHEVTKRLLTEFMTPIDREDIFELLRLIDDVTAHVGYEGSGNLDAVLRLVVLQQGSHDARQGKGRAVQRVTELRLLASLRTITALQTVGLIGVEVRYRRNLEPTSLSLGVNFEVVADGRGKTLIATA